MILWNKPSCMSHYFWIGQYNWLNLIFSYKFSLQKEQKSEYYDKKQ